MQIYMSSILVFINIAMIIPKLLCLLVISRLVVRVEISFQLLFFDSPFVVISDSPCQDILYGHQSLHAEVVAPRVEAVITTLLIVHQTINKIIIHTAQPFQRSQRFQNKDKGNGWAMWS